MNTAHRQPKKNLAKRWMILLGILVIGYFIFKAYWNFLLSPVDKSLTDVKVFVIPPGQSSSEIADRLQSEGFIRSASAFKFYLKRTDQISKLQAGDFKLSPAMNAEEIIKTLSSGSLDVWVTLLEGWRVEEMAEKLN